MNIIFNCLHCQQELEVDDTWGGQPLECPTCKKETIVPNLEAAEASPEPVEPLAPPPARSSAPPSAPAPVIEEDAIFKPKSSGANEIQRPLVRSLEAMAKGDKKIAIKTFRREECRKDGNDRFDETVSEFLRQLPDGDLIGVSPIHYSYPGKEPGQIFGDYGVVITFKQ